MIRITLTHLHEARWSGFLARLPLVLMRQRLKVSLALILLVVLVFGALGQGIRPAAAQSGGGYDLTWNTIGGGGGTFSTGGAYTLGGTVGQADAGALAGGSYTLVGGFWAGGLSVSIGGHIYYLPFIRR